MLSVCSDAASAARRTQRAVIHGVIVAAVHSALFSPGSPPTSHAGRFRANPLHPGRSRAHGGLRRARLGNRLLGGSAGLLLLTTAAPGLGSSWQYGVFPVPSFAGYTSAYGMRLHPLGGDLRPHLGIDIAAPVGSPVRSWWSGQVQEVIDDGGCGYGLVIRSGDYEHIYCHLSGAVSGGLYRSGPLTLAVGQWVRRGEMIATVGMTGSATGPHLHWGLRYRGTWLDPARVLRAMAASRRPFQPRSGSLNLEAMR